MINPYIKIGDVCHDLVKGGKVQVVGKAADTVTEHQQFNDYDVQTHKANALLEPSDDERVFKCVYLPEEPSTSFSGTYDFPESRLARVPVEEANGDLQRFQRGITENLLGMLISAGRDFDDTDHCPGPRELAREAGIPEEIVDAAAEFAQVDEQFEDGDGDE